MKELNNNSVASLNQQVLGASQQGAERTRSKGYLRYKTFAGEHAKNGDALVKFKDPSNAASGLRAASVEKDGFFGCDKIRPLFRRKVTEDANNNVRKDFVKSIIDSFEGAGDLNLLELNAKTLDELKLYDFIGKDKLKEATEEGRLTLRDIFENNMVTTGRPLSSRRITAITTVFENHESQNAELFTGNASRQEPVAQEVPGRPVGNRKQQKTLMLSPESVTKDAGLARSILSDIFIYSTLGENDGAEGCRRRLDEAAFTISVNGNAVTKGEDLKRMLNGIVKDDTAAQYLQKMLSRVSRFGVDSFLYKGIKLCDDVYREEKRSDKRPEINLTIALNEGKSDIELEVVEDRGARDERKATAVFTVSGVRDVIRKDGETRPVVTFNGV